MIDDHVSHNQKNSTVYLKLLLTCFGFYFKNEIFDM